MRGVLSFLAIVALCVGAAVAHGIAHDLVTAHLCVEYFTIGHPRIIETESPVALALFWGWFATWWMGAGLGLLLAIAARAGSRPKRRWRDLVGTVALVLLAMAAVALVAGLVGRFLAERGAVWLVGDLAERVPRERHVDYLTALWAHVASYAAGALGGVVAVGWTWIRRRAS